MTYFENEMNDLNKIKAAALAVCSWKLGTAWLDTSEDESAAVVGHIDEEGNEYPVITVDCDLYFQGQDSMPLAKYYAEANPSAVIELIERLEAAERDAALYRDLIYQVRRKFPDETRHETAFRYIRQAEAPSYSNAAMKEKQ